MKAFPLVLAFVANIAAATGTHTPPPVTPPAPTSISAGASSDAAAASKSAASSGSTSGAATGPVSVTEGASSFNAHSWSLFLPPPVFTPPMAPVSCGQASVEQSAMSITPIFSTAHGKTDASDCTLIQIRNAKVETCQYASAKQIEDLLVSKYLPGFVPVNDAKFVDFTARECAVIKSPPPVMPAVSFIPPAPVEVKCAAPVRKPKPKAVVTAAVDKCAKRAKQ